MQTDWVSERNYSILFPLTITPSLEGEGICVSPTACGWGIEKIPIKNLIFRPIFISFWILISLIFNFPIAAFALDTIEIHFIDAGHGEATLIKAPQNENILIDTGSLANGYKVKRYLQKQGVGELGAVIITHMHFDHVGGLFSLLPDISIEKIYDNGLTLKGNDFWEEYIQLVHNFSLKRGVLKHGDTLAYDELILQVLSPSEPHFNDLNSDSIAIRMQYVKIKVFFASDLNTKGEERLIAQGTDLKSQIIKIGHHGACDATSDAFLARVAPQVAIISVGKNNRFNFPCLETISRINSKGIRLFRTDITGTVVLKTDGEMYQFSLNRLY